MNTDYIMDWFVRLMFYFLAISLLATIYSMAHGHHDSYKALIIIIPALVVFGIRFNSDISRRIENQRRNKQDGK